jgi:dihydropyrimidine dehydrogenase (NAD+) subunit PreT
MMTNDLIKDQQFAASFAEIHPPLGRREALVEANRCLYCFDAPCTNACPTHIDVPGFIKKIASGNPGGSAMTILNANILGLSCARVCPVDVLCEGACVMHRYNQRPIEIGRLQRHAMDYFYGVGRRLPAAAAAKPGRVACIGAGPASLACAAALRQQGFAVTIFDSRPLAGGLNTYGVAEYKLRPADSLQEVELVRALGVEFLLSAEIGGERRIKELEEQFDIVFLGVGLGRTEPLDIPGEGLPEVIDALRFIADYKTRRGAHVGRRVVVVGGGNTAIDASTAALRLGAEEVHVLYRRSQTEMPAFEFEYDLAKQEGVQFHWLTQPVAIHGERAVESVECVRMELGPPDRRGRRQPHPVPGSNFRLPCDMLIPSIGQSRLLDFLSQFRDIRLAGGAVVVDPATGQTSHPRYFAGGDCVNGGREVVDAVAEGKRAAAGIARTLARKSEAMLEDMHG